MNFDILKEIGESGREAVFIYHLAAHRFEYLNQAASIIWERPPEWFRKDPVNVVSAVYPDDLPMVQAAFRQMQNGSRYWSGEVRIIMPAGGFKTVNLKVYQIRKKPEGVCLAGFAEDCSSQKSYEAYLLEFGNKKNSALEILAHDLAGPLNIAKNLATSLEQENLQLKSSQTAEYARIIQQVCENNLNLITNILSEEHLKSPSVNLKKELVDVIDLTRLVLTPYFSVSYPKKIEIRGDTGKIMAGVDKVKFSQIINNLVSNAIKFTPAHGKIRFTFTDTGREVLITVADNGIGIPDHLQPFVFGYYTMASRPGLNGERSRGIGLSITKTLVEMHLGKIWFESKENVGTTFYILFPKSFA